MIASQTLPDYLPARMLNEFVYCPRLFYYEWVEGVFVDNRHTVAGSLRHAKIDKKQDRLPPADSEEQADGKIHSRSVTLSSDTHRLIAKMDLIECTGGEVTPVDYKQGSPFKNNDGSLGAWDTDRVQLAAQALVLFAKAATAVKKVCSTTSPRSSVSGWPSMNRSLPKRYRHWKPRGQRPALPRSRSRLKIAPNAPVAP